MSEDRIHSVYKKAVKNIPPTKPIGIYYIPTKKDFMVLAHRRN